MRDPIEKRQLLLMAAAAAAVVLLLATRGQPWTCSEGGPALLWCGDAWSPHTSQHLFDPYSFTHLLHGFVGCALLHGIGRGRVPLGWMLVLAVVGEGCWELLENSPYVIATYRSNTASLDYHGDSILNSVGDMLCCTTGLWVSHRLGLWRAVAVFVAVEVGLLLWIHDSLLLNILMLLHPLPAIKAWQGG